MEAAGIEPASRDISAKASTCVVVDLVLVPKGPQRQGPPKTSRERFLTAGVPDMTRGDPELATDFWDSPAKARSRGCLFN
jgi:hypothetical protein